jgi:hypothetical protein
MGAGQSHELTSPEYGAWLQQQLIVLRALPRIPPQHCVANYHDCLDFTGVIGRGGTATVLEAVLRPDAACATVFSPPQPTPVAVKVCNAGLLTDAACRASFTEILHMVELSALYQRRLCDNFLTCLGYGIACPLLVAEDELGRPVDTWRHAHVVGMLDQDDLDDYVADQEAAHGDTFIIMTRVNGADLASKPAGFTLTPRQAFGYVYSLLCAVVELGKIPGDRHLDNLMEHDTGVGVVYTIGARRYAFPETVTLLHIDYLAMSDAADLRWGDLVLKQQLGAYAPAIRGVLDAPLPPVDKVHALAAAFGDHAVEDAPADATQLVFPYDPVSVRVHAPDAV